MIFIMFGIALAFWRRSEEDLTFEFLQPMGISRIVMKNFKY